MSNFTYHQCPTCIHAKWHRTASGSLHPSGDGICKFPTPDLPALPSVYSWHARGAPANPLGSGIIIRKKQHDWDKPILDCPTYQSNKKAGDRT